MRCERARGPSRLRLIAILGVNARYIPPLNLAPVKKTAETHPPCKAPRCGFGLIALMRFG
jgi:hypothetical protein